ncbi:MAG: hypothetical protein AAF401_11360 [Pseudomonadota bacterium]
MTLSFIGAAGLGWLVADVMGWLTSETEQAERRVLLAAADSQLDALAAEAAGLDRELEAQRKDIAETLTSIFGIVPPVTNRSIYWGLSFGPDGELVAVGENGLILTRAAGATDWVDASRTSEVGNIFGLSFGPDGEAVAVGQGGFILTRDAGLGHWVDVSLPDEGRTIYGLSFGPDGEVVAVGQGGLIVRRASGAADWVDVSHPDERRWLYGLGFGPDGEAVAVGASGLIMTRAAGTADWIDVSRPDEDRSLHGFSFGPDGEALAVGQGGLILTRAAGAGDWVDVSLSDEDRTLWDLSFGPDGEVVAVGQGGLIVRRESGTADWIDFSLPDEDRRLMGVSFGPDREVFAGGHQGLIVSRSGASVTSARDAADEAALRLAVLAAPAHPKTQDWLARIGSLQDRRAPLNVRIAAARQQREAAAQGTLTDETKLKQMETFLTGCAAASAIDAEGHLMVTACTAAYKQALADEDNAFFEYLAQRLTPLALLIFLLATLGGAYRYNARLAGFYHARADALEAAAFTEDEEGLERLVTAFGAEKTPFKEQRLPIDAATDFAKEALSKVRGGA